MCGIFSDLYKMSIICSVNDQAIGTRFQNGSPLGTQNKLPRLNGRWMLNSSPVLTRYHSMESCYPVPSDSDFCHQAFSDTGAGAFSRCRRPHFPSVGQAVFTENRLSAHSLESLETGSFPN